VPRSSFSPANEAAVAALRHAVRLPHATPSSARAGPSSPARRCRLPRGIVCSPMRRRLPTRAARTVRPCGVAVFHATPSIRPRGAVCPSVRRGLSAHARPLSFYAAPSTCPPAWRRLSVRPRRRPCFAQFCLLRIVVTDTARSPPVHSHRRFLHVLSIVENRCRLTVEAPRK
jgi:hypothetical protein